MASIIIDQIRKREIESMVDKMYDDLMKDRDVRIGVEKERTLCMLLKKYKDDLRRRRVNVVVKNNVYSIDEAYNAMCKIGVDPFLE
jgi:uncharacterized membrane-anchored protein YjiN (DUF445 family)